MPVYEYACQKCQRQFEVLVRTQNLEIACPDCGGHDLKKLISRFNSSSGSAEPEFSGGGCGQCGSTTPGVCNWQN